MTGNIGERVVERASVPFSGMFCAARNIEVLSTLQESNGLPLVGPRGRTISCLKVSVLKKKERWQVHWHCFSQPRDICHAIEAAVYETNQNNIKNLAEGLELL
jgi:hypothetical protein